MAKFYVVLRTLVMLFVIVIGAVFLWAGIGGTIPLIEIKEFKGYGIPLGLVVIGLGIFIPKLWPIEEGWTVTHTHSGSSNDGSSGGSAGGSSTTTSSGWVKTDSKSTGDMQL